MIEIKVEAAVGIKDGLPEIKEVALKCNDFLKGRKVKFRGVIGITTETDYDSQDRPIIKYVAEYGDIEGEII